MLHAIGIGDLHLDGKLRKHIPDLNQVVMRNVHSVLDKAVKKGIRHCFLYGDVCDTPVMSSDALQQLLRLFNTYSQIKFTIIKGNHDTHDNQTSSLDTLRCMSELRMLPNVKVVLDTPSVLFKNTDHPVQLLPWPHKDTLKGHLNVLHVEALGAKWDTGRDVTEGIDTPNLCVIGHIHTAQRVRNMHFSGTLYQTNFGEAQEKYYHEITWTGSVKDSEVKLVRHRPTYLLHNTVIRTEEEYTAFVAKASEADDATQANYYKVFVNSKDVLLPGNAFDNVPGVIKLNSFRSKAELKVLMTDELELDDASGQFKFSTDAVLQDWMKQNDVDVELRDRALSKLEQLMSKTLA
jgi:DNA repair exonuclease SbcCD nuclease subunit